MKIISAEDTYSTILPIGYTREDIKELWAGRERLSASEVAALDVPCIWRTMIVVRCMLDDTAARLLSCWCAERFVAKIREDDPERLVIEGALAIAKKRVTAPDNDPERSVAGIAVCSLLYEDCPDHVMDDAAENACQVLRAACLSNAHQGAWDAVIHAGENGDDYEPYLQYAVGLVNGTN